MRRFRGMTPKVEGEGQVSQRSQKALSPWLGVRGQGAVYMRGHFGEDLFGRGGNQGLEVTERGKFILIYSQNDSKAR